MLLWGKIKIHDLISYDSEAVISPKVGELTKSDVGGFVVADIAEMVFGSIMADYVGDYVSVSYFVEIPTSQ